ncbi:MAG: hypothetical protein WA981_11450 [Glaciecola sp.]
MQSWLRLLASALIAFCSYAAWAYYANSLVTTNTTTLFKAAIVQGTYSGAVTLAFTFLLEVFYKHFKSKSYCLAFIVPRINKDSLADPCKTKQTFDASLRLSETICSGRCLPGVLLSPLPALLIQSVLVIAINIIFATPNLWLTVAPSILFSGIYGYAYSIGLHRKS